MAASRWDRLEALLEQAWQLPTGERSAFVEGATRDDPGLHDELVTLLAAATGADAYVSRLQRDLLGSDVLDLLDEAPAAAGEPDPWVGRTISHYEIQDRIGGGGMGVVYRARDVRLDRPVALKFIAPEIRRDDAARRRFLHEARAASALDHPNICTIHEVAETEDERLFIVMTAYDGETLRARLERDRPPDHEALAIGRQIAAALAAAHARGIVHRDVKPENVFVTRDGVVKLLDFGLARTDDSRMSAAGGVRGTVAYMSPEQARGARADERSDVWSLGVILFEMLAGERPFVADDARGTIERILRADPDLRTRRPDLPAGPIDAVARALAKDPAARFADAGRFLEALLEADPRAAADPAPRRYRRSRAVRTGAVMAGLLGIVTVVALRVRSANHPAPVVEAGTAPHVLWVDDDPANNRFIIEQFTDLGVRVTTALTTTEAVEQYDPGVYQLVISDMGRYEGANNAYVARAGLNLLAALQARHDDPPVAFCTSARAVELYRDEALAAGARDIVTRCEVILRLLGREPTSPEVPAP